MNECAIQPKRTTVGGRHKRPLPIAFSWPCQNTIISANHLTVRPKTEHCTAPSSRITTPAALLQPRQSGVSQMAGVHPLRRSLSPFTCQTHALPSVFTRKKPGRSLPTPSHATDSSTHPSALLLPVFFKNPPRGPRLHSRTPSRTQKPTSPTNRHPLSAPNPRFEPRKKQQGTSTPQTWPSRTVRLFPPFTPKEKPSPPQQLTP